MPLCSVMFWRYHFKFEHASPLCSYLSLISLSWCHSECESRWWNTVEYSHSGFPLCVSLISLVQMRAVKCISFFFKLSGCFTSVFPGAPAPHAGSGSEGPGDQHGALAQPSLLPPLWQELRIPRLKATKVVALSSQMLLESKRHKLLICSHLKALRPQQI